MVAYERTSIFDERKNWYAEGFDTFAEVRMGLFFCTGRKFVGLTGCPIVLVDNFLPRFAT
jgi:hypothetical protein